MGIEPGKLKEWAADARHAKEAPIDVWLTDEAGKKANYPRGFLGFHIEAAEAIPALIEELLELLAHVIASHARARECASRKGQIVAGPDEMVIYTFPGMSQGEILSLEERTLIEGRAQARRELGLDE